MIHINKQKGLTQTFSVSRSIVCETDKLILKLHGQNTHEVYECETEDLHNYNDYITLQLDFTDIVSQEYILCVFAGEIMIAKTLVKVTDGDEVKETIHDNPEVYEEEQFKNITKAEYYDF